VTEIRVCGTPRTYTGRRINPRDVRKSSRMSVSIDRCHPPSSGTLARACSTNKSTCDDVVDLERKLVVLLRHSAILATGTCSFPDQCDQFTIHASGAPACLPGEETMV
jgi:hypothetical protein